MPRKKKRHYKNWTIAENNFLQRNYKTMPCKEIAWHLKRSISSVRHHCFNLGIKKCDTIVREESNLVRKVKIYRMLHDPRMSIYDIAKEVKYTVMRIIKIAYQLKKANDWILIRKKISVARKRMYQEFEKDQKVRYYQKNRERIIEYNGTTRPNRLKQEKLERYKKLGWTDPVTGEIQSKHY